MTYEEFLARKRKTHVQTGVNVEVSDDGMFPFQRHITEWALRTGKACIFAGTGLGKTRMQIQFANHVGGVRLIFAPLAVNAQTINEAASLGVAIKYAASSDDIGGEGIYITNYDRAELFGDVAVDAVILDESSIIKSHDGKYRQYLQDRFKDTPFKLCLTATPAPNDYMELGTHAEFVGAMTRLEMLATYFTHDGGDTSKWRLKGHARRQFWEWVKTWAMVLNHPRDIGFDQKGYDLPDLEVHHHIVETDHEGSDLFGGVDVNATSLHKVLRDSAPERVAKTLELINQKPDAPWLIWVNTNDEQQLVKSVIDGVVSVDGADSREVKEDRLIGFSTGKYRRLVTKPKIAGFGMNWQRCADMVFCGVNYSFEQQYQAIRRCYRFGQQKPVHVHYVTCNGQQYVMDAVKFKESAAKTMIQEMTSK